MKIIETLNLRKLIPSDYFNICKIDKFTRKQILEWYKKEEVTKRKSVYFLDKFEYHIKQYNITLKEYCKKYLEIDWPTCPISNKEVGFKICGKGLMLSKFAVAPNKEFCPKFKEWCDRMSIERAGKGNPVFGKKAWNSGLTSELDMRVKKCAEKRIGHKISEETRLKQSKAMYKRIEKNGPLHAIPHSSETCEKLRKHTANLWATGIFRKVTSIHIKIREFLKTLNLKETPQEEYQVKYYSLDFALPDHKVGIECQGTYFHIDPRIYPNGPKDKIQRRNFGRDKAKKTYLTNKGWIIIESWETEINDGSFKNHILCKLKELNLLKD